MKKSSFLPLFSGIFCLLLSLSPCLTAGANSAQARWSGISSTGAMVTDESCPIEVERELLTFDLMEFPADYFMDEGAYQSYGGQVTAEYSFYNPADYTVTATLLFPMGNPPSYHGISYGIDGLYSRSTDVDADKFNITVNGNVIEKQLRHSFSYSHEQFELEKDLPRLADNYVEDAFYTPKLPVRKYTYRISDVDLNTYDAANAAFDLSVDSSRTRIYFPQYSGFSGFTDGSVRLSAWVLEHEPLMTVYVLGEPLKEPLEWKFYENGAVDDNQKIPGTASLVATEDLTFSELVLADWKEHSGVSRTDWYNAVVTMLLEDSLKGNGPSIGFDLGGRGLSPTLLCWYQYEITLEPGERITNTVTAPMYPAIDQELSPSVYDYTYLLSPASTWAGFEALEIVIRTPYHMLGDQAKRFSKTEDGYTLSLDGLPEGELEFSLCASERPVGEFPSHRNYILRQLVIPLILLVVLLTGCILLGVFLYRRKHIRKSR
ncbi:MAG: hypothetical protein HFI42_04355 [Lachnospiraceae bacterium]|nr:hypothetical protein [Lachnospiraceae bacterium]